MYMQYILDDNLVTRVKIYDISYNSNGFPLFLIYYEGQWIRKSAKHFKPIKENDYE